MEHPVFNNDDEPSEAVKKDPQYQTHRHNADKGAIIAALGITAMGGFILAGHAAQKGMDAIDKSNAFTTQIIGKTPVKDRNDLQKSAAKIEADSYQSYSELKTVKDAALISVIGSSLIGGWYGIGAFVEDNRLAKRRRREIEKAEKQKSEGQGRS